MTQRVISMLLVLGVLFSLFVEPGIVRGQVVAQSNPNMCALPAGAAASAGSRFRHAGDSIYYVCWRVLGRDAQPGGPVWLPGEVRANRFFLSAPMAGGECTRAGNLSYSVGAVVRFGESTYRCSTVVDQDLHPNGVAWVEVEVRDNQSFAIKGRPLETP